MPKKEIPELNLAELEKELKNDNKLEEELNMDNIQDELAEINLIDTKEEIENNLINERPTITLIQKTKKEDENVEETYKYKNADGQTIFIKQKRRGNGEKYLLGRVTEEGEIQYGLNGIEVVPYNLPDVIKAVENEEVIFITEGESKCDCLKELGFTATTAPYKGEKKWKDRFNSYIKNARIIIIEDNDSSGEEFAKNTAEVVFDATENLAILKITDIAPNIKTGADIKDLRNIMQDDEKLKSILDTISSNI